MPEATAESTFEALLEAIEDVLALPEVGHVQGHARRRPSSRWLKLAGGLVLLALASGWVWSFMSGHTRPAMSGPGGAMGSVSMATRRVAASLTDRDAPSTTFLTDAALRAFAGERGASGKLHAVIETPGAAAFDSLPAGANVTYTRGEDVAGSGARVPARPGVWSVALKVGQAVRTVADLSVITMRPFSDKQGGRIGSYTIGRWPAEAGRRGLTGRYANPRGFIEVTPENQNTPVSEHFQLRDFLTKGQQNVWPKYLVLELRTVDKLELILAELRKRGIKTEGVVVMSGFRTPSYNSGGGNTSGRAGLSRHMYGDAADIFIDNDRNGVMDDLNRDGRVDVRDARVMSEAADVVERAHPELVGGVGTYSANAGHGPFIHVDTRGYRARWTGSGGG